MILDRSILNNKVTKIFSNFFTSLTKKFTFEDLPLRLSFSYKHMGATLALSQDKFKLSKVSTYDVEVQLAELSPCLTDLFNLCIVQAAIPNDWKLEHITPVYKGSKSSPDNYRPISVLTSIFKVFESLISAKIKNHLEHNKLLDDCEFGFMPFRLCELALNTMIEDWRRALDSKNHLLAVFSDLSKAFDTVCHKLLLRKMSFFNFDISATSLLADYLNIRRIRVKDNDTLSKETEEEARNVPQGSILGSFIQNVYKRPGQY
jgi:hypothetical protein